MSKKNAQDEIRSSTGNGMEQTEHGGRALAEAVRKAYANGLDDYHMPALVSRSHRMIQDGDSVVFCCRRGEREIELTEMFTDSAFSIVPRKRLHELDFVLLTQYHEKFRHLPIAFTPEKVDLPLAQALSMAGKPSSTAPSPRSSRM